HASWRAAVTAVGRLFAELGDRDAFVPSFGDREVLAAVSHTSPLRLLRLQLRQILKRLPVQFHRLDLRFRMALVGHSHLLLCLSSYHPTLSIVLAAQEGREEALPCAGAVRVGTTVVWPLAPQWGGSSRSYGTETHL